VKIDIEFAEHFSAEVIALIFIILLVLCIFLFIRDKRRTNPLKAGIILGLRVLSCFFALMFFADPTIRIEREIESDHLKIFVDTSRSMHLNVAGRLIENVRSLAKELAILLPDVTLEVIYLDDDENVMSGGFGNLKEAVDDLSGGPALIYSDFESPDPQLLNPLLASNIFLLFPKLKDSRIMQVDLPKRGRIAEKIRGRIIYFSMGKASLHIPGRAPKTVKGFGIEKFNLRYMKPGVKKLTFSLMAEDHFKENNILEKRIEIFRGERRIFLSFKNFDPETGFLIRYLKRFSDFKLEVKRRAGGKIPGLKRRPYLIVLFPGEDIGPREQASMLRYVRGGGRLLFSPIDFKMDDLFSSFFKKKPGKAGVFFNVETGFFEIPLGKEGGLVPFSLRLRPALTLRSGVGIAKMEGESVAIYSPLGKGMISAVLIYPTYRMKLSGSTGSIFYEKLWGKVLESILDEKNSRSPVELEEPAADLNFALLRRRLEGTHTISVKTYGEKGEKQVDFIRFAKDDDELLVPIKGKTEFYYQGELLGIRSGITREERHGYSILQSSEIRKIAIDRNLKILKSKIPPLMGARLQKTEIRYAYSVIFFILFFVPLCFEWILRRIWGIYS